MKQKLFLYDHGLWKLWLTVLTMIFSFSLTAHAKQVEPEIPDSFASHKIVLQISDRDPFKQTLVLNVASNLLKYYGKDDVDIEVVAFGPGLRLLMEGNVNTPRIQTLMAEGVRFSGCKNTLVNFGKKLGKQPKLIPEVMVVPAGAARILQLNAAGYQTLKP